MSLGRAIKVAINGVLRATGHMITRVPYQGGLPRTTLPLDFSEEDIELWERVQPYTMTPPDRILTLTEAVAYVIKQDIPGDFVECGCWRGGQLTRDIVGLVALG